MSKRKWKMHYKWRKHVTFSIELIEDQPAMLQQMIREGYKYNKGFKAVAHRSGICGDDFIQNRITILFYLIKVPRICRR
jgi:hypothetical protein